MAAVEMVLYEAVHADDRGRHDDRELDEVDSVRLEELYEPLPFPDYPGWWDPGVRPGIQWFGGAELLLRLDGRSWLWVLARSSAPGTGFGTRRRALAHGAALMEDCYRVSTSTQAMGTTVVSTRRRWRWPLASVLQLAVVPVWPA